MSDLVGNPEDRFSHNEAQIASACNRNVTQHLIISVYRNEPRSEKNGLRGFRPGPTQTGLYSHRRWLEA